MTGASRLDLEELQREALDRIGAAPDKATLEQLRIQYLGRKAALKELLSTVGSLAPEERRAVGQAGNAVAGAIEAALLAREQALSASGALLQNEAIDLSFPAPGPRRGHPHPVSRVMLEIEEIFRGLGYDVARGPEVETDYYNFEALNLPPGHPARDNHDSFFIATGAPGENGASEGKVLLRTHTSPMQVRIMERQKPPIRVIVPGKTYRRDDDATHTPMFHQIEGLYIDEGVSLADLKGTLEYVARALFGEGRRIRLRPNYFPFTEPSVELDVSCFMCDGAGCRLCGHSGWIELAGAGMVHPNVLKRGGIDPNRYTGFAFGMGADRMAMLKYGIDDLRPMFDNDLRMIRQF